MDQAIAGHYDTFYSEAPTDPDAAKEALRKARVLDQENAYTLYLMASLAAQEGDFATAFENLEQGNALTKTIVYVSAPPPADPMQSLTRFRQLGFASERAVDSIADPSSYFSALRTAGARVAKAEPIASLAVLNGVGVVRKAYQAEISYWKEASNQAKSQDLQRQLDEFQKWNESMTDGLAATLVDLMREAGKEAGLTEQELADYANRKPLRDKAKQRTADEARGRLYDREVEALRRALESMPEVG